MTAVPLRCSICPKKPKFSDISHLLTHVGSKGHLSQYFKLQVRGRSDISARIQIENYDQWYQQNDLERLLSERLHTKEYKKARGAGHHRKKNNQESPKVEKGLQKPILDWQIPLESNICLDPRLSQNQYSKLQNTTTTPPTQSYFHQPNELTRVSKSSRQRAWETRKSKLQGTSHNPSEQNTDAFISDDHLIFAPKEENPSSYGSPSLESYSQLFYPKPTKPNAGGMPSPIALLEQKTIFGAINADLDGCEESPISSESPKLKGVHWPGMNIFDSATPERKRKRNQKKDGSNLKQMLITSNNVEPTERIYTPNGSLKKERHISGMVESSSPLHGEPPTEKKRKRASRKKPLAEYTSSAINARNGSRSSRCDTVLKLEDDDHMDASKNINTAYSNPYSPTFSFGNRCGNLKVEEPDFFLSTNRIPKHKDNFTVFEDYSPFAGPTNSDASNANRNPNLNISSRPTQLFTPGRFGLDSSFNGFNARSKTSQDVSSTNRQAESQLHGLECFTANNKENLKPLMTSDGDQDAVNHRTTSDWLPQKSRSVLDSYPLHFFQSQHSSAFDSFLGSDISTYSFNPLSVSFQKQYIPGPEPTNDANPALMANQRKQGFVRSLPVEGNFAKLTEKAQFSSTGEN